MPESSFLLPPFLPPTPERPPATAKSKSKRPRTTSDREQATANDKRPPTGLVKKVSSNCFQRKKVSSNCYHGAPTYGKSRSPARVPWGHPTFIESSIFIMVFSILKIFHIKRRLSEKYCEIIKKPQGFSLKLKTCTHMTIFHFS